MIGRTLAHFHIAMEFVEGRTLTEVIGGRPLPVKEALRIGIEVAEGLAKAHAAHVIHRDLKPDNIIVTPDGRVKIPDFGLAKLLDERDEPGSAHSRLQTISGDMTLAGRILGTATYMSPEQARGEIVDVRTDTSRSGSRCTRWRPAGCRQECLEKDAAERYQHADQLVVDLRRLKKRIETGTIQARSSGPVQVSLARKRTGARVIGMVAVVVALGLGTAAWLALRGRPAAESGQPAAPRLAFTRITLDSGEELSPSLSADGKSVRRLTDSGHDPAWSPDGREIAWATEAVVSPYQRSSESRLWVADAFSGMRRQLPTEDAIQPAWSPNGLRVVYWAAPGGQRDVWTIPAKGGDPVPVTHDPATDWSPVWSPDGRHIYFSSDRGGSMNLWRIPVDEASGRPLGPPEPVTAPACFAGNLGAVAQ